MWYSYRCHVSTDDARMKHTTPLCNLSLPPTQRHDRKDSTIQCHIYDWRTPLLPPPSPLPPPGPLFLLPSLPFSSHLLSDKLTRVDVFGMNGKLCIAQFELNWCNVANCTEVCSDILTCEMIWYDGACSEIQFTWNITVWGVLCCSEI